MAEIRKDNDGNQTSFFIDTENGSTLLRHKNHIRHDIKSTDRVSDKQLSFSGEASGEAVSDRI